MSDQPLPRFIVGEDPNSEKGFLIHTRVPEFRARWGEAPLDAEGLVFSDAQSDPDEDMDIWDFVFEGDIPSEEVIRNVCTSALKAIDQYLENKIYD